MAIRQGAAAGALGLSVMLLASCEDGGPFGQASFRGQYAVARQALETGQYDQAIRVYDRLMERAGPLQARLRLERAHAQLRAGDYAGAGAEARAVAAMSQGANRAAALAVAGVAEHELGLAALKSGDRAAAARFLRAADASMKSALEGNAEIDPHGALAGRRAQVKVQLKRLG